MSAAAGGMRDFQDPALLRRALTHASADGGENNEQLEWLGDALLDFLASDMLRERYPDAGEGVLTQARASIVNGSALAAVARRLGLPARLRMSPGEHRSGGRGRDSILAGALEAYLAAIYLDGGVDAARQETEKWFAGMMEGMSPGPDKFKDAKTLLQERMQKRGRPPPNYDVLDRGSIARRPYCVVRCECGGDFAVAVAANRREAEQAAGSAVLARLASRARSGSTNGSASA